MPNYHGEKFRCEANGAYPYVTELEEVKVRNGGMDDRHETSHRTIDYYSRMEECRKRL